MNSFIFSFVICGIFFSSLFGDITSNLSTYSKIECEFKQRSLTDKKHKHKHHHSRKNKKSSSHTPLPNISIGRGTSINWSGYVAVADVNCPVIGSVSSVSGAWIVPELLSTNDTSYTAIWVGIDGHGSPTVEQLGTEHIWTEGTQQNIAWYEMYPNPAYQIEGFPVSIGDVIEAEVLYTGSDQFQLSMINHTRNVYAVIPFELTRSSIAKRSSAEWVVEAPYSSGVLPLSNFQTISFLNCRTVINDISGSIASNNWRADHLTMTTLAGAIKAIPSNLSSDYGSFTVSWVHE